MCYCIRQKSKPCAALCISSSDLRVFVLSMSFVQFDVFLLLFSVQEFVSIFSCLSMANYLGHIERQKSQRLTVPGPHFLDV